MQYEVTVWQACEDDIVLAISSPEDWFDSHGGRLRNRRLHTRAARPDPDGEAATKRLLQQVSEPRVIDRERSTSVDRLGAYTDESQAAGQPPGATLQKIHRCSPPIVAPFWWPDATHENAHAIERSLRKPHESPNAAHVAGGEVE